MGDAVAVNVVIPDVPPIFRVALAAWVNPPVPDKAVPTVNVLLLVSVTPVTVTLGIDNVPASACAFVSNVCTPVPELKVPLLVMPPLNVTGEFAAVLVHVPPAATVTRPTKVLVPVAEVIVRLPLVPPPTVVVPVTVKLKPATVNVVPSPTESAPPTVVAIPVVVFVLPLVLRLLKVVLAVPPIV